MGRACVNCLLPKLVPGVELDGRGLCGHCRTLGADYATTEEQLRQQREADLEAALAACRGQGEYDCLVNLSGGKDSCYLLHKITREYGLKALAFTVDVQLTEIAWRNIRRTVARLDVPHVTFRPPVEFYRKLFRYLLTHQEERGAVRSVCYVCASLCEGYALRLAMEKRIPLILAGYSPGQPEPDRMVYEFSRETIGEQDWTPPELRASGLFDAAELEQFWNPRRYPAGTRFPRFLAPFHAWPYSQSDTMRAVVELGLAANRRHANPVYSNCPVNWLLMYSDLRQLGYNPYSPEFSRLIREGKASRWYWRLMTPVVNGMIRHRVFLGRNVTKSLEWLGLRPEELRITRRAAPAIDSPAAAQTIPAMLRSRIAQTPDLTVYARRTAPSHWKPTRWREFGAEVGHLAACLAARGFAPGERLAILARTRPEWQLLEMAGLLAGGVIVGIAPHSSPDQAAAILADSEATVLVVDNLSLLQQLPTAQCEQLRLIIVLDQAEKNAGHANVVGWKELGASRGADERWEGPTVLPEHPATWIYTSGTTGAPKAIPYSHGQLLTACRAILETYPQLVEGDVTLCWLPMAHLFQRMMNLAAMARGMPIHVVDDPHRVMACVREVNPAVLVGVPRFYEKLRDGILDELARLRGWRKWLAKAAFQLGAAPRETALDTEPEGRLLHAARALLDFLVLRRVRRVMGTKLKFMITGTAPIGSELLDLFFRLGLPVLEAYGISENAVPMAANRPDDYRLGSVGKPLAGNELRFADDGEILVKGPGVFPGYCHDTSATAPFTADGFFQTGDLGFLDEDGFLFLTGRKAEIIKTSTGRRLAPHQVEAAYGRSPYLDQVIVIGNGRPYLVGLLGLNHSRVRGWLAQHGEPTKGSDAELAARPAVRNLIQRELETLGQELAAHERIVAFDILPAPLSAEQGELTPTGKLCRARIGERHAASIARLYHRDAASAHPGLAVRAEGKGT